MGVLREAIWEQRKVKQGPRDREPITEEPVLEKSEKELLEKREENQERGGVGDNKRKNLKRRRRKKHQVTLSWLSSIKCGFENFDLSNFGSWEHSFQWIKNGRSFVIFQNALKDNETNKYIGFAP